MNCLVAQIPFIGVGVTQQHGYPRPGAWGCARHRKKRLEAKQPFWVAKPVLGRRSGLGWPSLGMTLGSHSILTARSIACSVFTSPATSPTSTRQYLPDGSARLAR